jgi:tight adherence protein B
MTQAVYVVAFLMTLGVVGIGIALRMGSGDRKRMSQRITLITESAASAKRPQDSVGSRMRLAQFDSTVRGIFGLGMGRSWAMTANTLVLSILAVAGGAALWFFTRQVIGLSPLLSMLAAAAGFVMAPRFVLKRQQRTAEAAFSEAFPDAVDSVTRMLQAGMPITSALRAVGNETMPPVSRVFNNIADQTNMGVSISDAVDASSKHIGLADYRFFAVAIVLQSSTGGNLVSTLDKLSGILRKRRAVRKKAKAATSEVRFAAYILGALPFVTIGALLFIQPNYLNILFTDPRGHMLIGIAAGLLFLAAVSIRTMMASISNV